MYLARRTWLQDGPRGHRPVYVPRRVRRGRGLGEPISQYCAGSSVKWWDPASWACPFVPSFWSARATPTPPPPVPPDVTLTSDASAPGAIYAGTDPQTGSAVYAVPQTAQANVAATVAQLQDFYASQVPAPPDCSGWFAQTFTTGCGGSPWIAVAGGGLLLLLVGGFFRGGRR